MTDRDARLGELGEQTGAEKETLVLHEEEAHVTTEPHEAGAVRAYKSVAHEPFDELVPRDVEEADVQRLPAGENDSGEIEVLPDGAVSIPILEEELVITKQTVVRERLLIRKRWVSDPQRVQAELRRERVTIEADEGIEVEETTE